MAKTTNEKVDIIKKRLLNVAKNSDRESDNTIFDDELEKVIAQVAGRDKRTVEKYRRYIEQEDDIIRLNENKISLQYKSDVDRDIQSIISSPGIRSERVPVEKGVIDIANNMGMEINDAVKTTLINSVGAIEDIVERRSISNEEQTYITRLIVYGLYPKDGGSRQIGDTYRGRKEVYKSVFDVDSIGNEEDRHIEQLRREAFDVAAVLNIASEPPSI